VSKKKKKTKTVVARRLTTMCPSRVALTAKGANQAMWLVVKSAIGDRVMLDAKKIADAITTLKEVHTVAKSGQLDEAASEAVGGKMKDIHALLFANVNDFEKIKEDLTNLRSKTTEVLETTTDLNIHEGLEGIQEDIDTLLNRVKPQEEPQAASTETPETPPETPPATPETPPAAATSTETAETPPATETPAETPAAEEPSAEDKETVVSKADLMTFGKGLIDGMTKVMKEGFAQVAKSTPALPTPATPPAGPPVVTDTVVDDKTEWPDDLSEEVHRDARR
jgi:hypothetical protein